MLLADIVMCERHTLLGLRTAGAQNSFRGNVVVHHYVWKKGCKIHLKGILVKTDLRFNHQSTPVCYEKFFSGLPLFCKVALPRDEHAIPQSLIDLQGSHCTAGTQA